MTDDAWQELSAAEAKAARPFKLDCTGLSGNARDEIRSKYVRIAARCVRLAVRTLDRIPTDAEIDTLRTAVTRYFNQTIIPELRAVGSVH